MTSAIAATGLGRRFGKKWALKECDFELPAGKIAGLVGPNGAGKTTLLHIAVGLLRPTRGTMLVLGASPANRGILSRLGFVAQDTPLYRDFSVGDHLRLGNHLNANFDDALARGRLSSLDLPLEQQAGSLSGGQRAQLALSLALAKRPEILLLDEPLASLDPLARREFLQTLMEGVAEEGTTVVLSSHLLTDLERVCDHMMVLAGGTFRLIGDTSALVASHKLLVGPTDKTSAITGVAQVVRESRTDRQATLLVRTEGPIMDPSWSVHEVSLEDLVLAHLDPRVGQEITGRDLSPSHIELVR